MDDTTMEKRDAEKLCVYIGRKYGGTYQKIRSMSSDEKVSVSDLVCRGMQQLCLQSACGVSISREAYPAIAEGRFEDLIRVRQSDGVKIMLKSEVYAPVDGTPGRYAAMIESLSAL